MKPYPPVRYGRQARISAMILLLLPVALALFMAVITPRYFAPLVHASLGRILILAMAVLYVLGAGTMLWIVRRVESQKMDARIASLVMLVPLMLFVFPVIWIILLGPGLVVVAGG